MRARLAILPVLLVAVAALIPAPLANATSGHHLYLSQAEPGDETTEQNNQGGGGEDAETEVETGPLWTYQMAWMSFALILVLLLGAGSWYYRLVVKRGRGEV